MADTSTAATSADREVRVGLLPSGLVTAYQIGSQIVVVETEGRREIRITAKRELGTGAYVAEYERRTTLVIGGTSYHVWARTSAYPQCRADDAHACLEAAMKEAARPTVT
jgi:hypothetical protein